MLPTARFNFFSSLFLILCCNLLYSCSNIGFWLFCFVAICLLFSYNGFVILLCSWVSIRFSSPCGVFCNQMGWVLHLTGGIFNTICNKCPKLPVHFFFLQVIKNIARANSFGWLSQITLGFGKNKLCTIVYKTSGQFKTYFTMKKGWNIENSFEMAKVLPSIMRAIVVAWIMTTWMWMKCSKFYVDVDEVVNIDVNVDKRKWVFTITMQFDHIVGWKKALSNILSFKQTMPTWN